METTKAVRAEVEIRNTAHSLRLQSRGMIRFIIFLRSSKLLKDLARRTGISSHQRQTQTVRLSRVHHRKGEENLLRLKLDTGHTTTPILRARRTVPARR